MIFFIRYIVKEKEEYDMPITTYLNFNGNCKEALMSYQKIFKTDAPRFMTFFEMPGSESLPEHLQAMILHAEINLLDTKIYASDSPNDEKHPYKPGNHTILTIEVKAQEEAKYYYEHLKEGGIVTTPFGPTFFSDAFAELEDRFGIHWMIMVE